MDEVEFKNHAEKEFWENVYLACIGAGDALLNAMQVADESVAARRVRMAGLIKPPGVKAA